MANLFLHSVRMAACSAVVFVGTSFAEEVKGPVHITGRGEVAESDARASAQEAREAMVESRRDMLNDIQEARADMREAREDARARASEARQDLEQAKRDLEEHVRDMASLEAGTFAGTIVIDGEVRCYTSERPAGCKPLTETERAELRANVREAIDNARDGLAAAFDGLADAEASLETDEVP